MSEHEIKLETRRILALSSILIMGSLGLSGRAGVEKTVQTKVEQATTKTDVTKLTPASRFDNDYAWFGCLKTTPYAPVEGGAPSERSFSYNSDSDILSVYVPDGPTLQLEGTKEAETTLQPVDATTQQVFAAYGCVVTPEK